MSGRSCGQGERFCKNTLSQVRGEATFGDHVDGAPQKVLQVLLDGDDIQQASIGFEIDEEVEIAVGSLLAPSPRAEHPHRMRAVCSSNLQDLCRRKSRGHHAAILRCSTLHAKQ